MVGRRRPAHVHRLRDQQPLLLGRSPPPNAVLIEEDPRLLHAPPRHRLPQPHHHHHRALIIEERLGEQHREIQALLLDNQRLAATHVALVQNLHAATHELRLAAAAAARTRGVQEAQVRDLYERSVEMEAEARLIEPIRAELAHVQSDVQTLGGVREELVERLRGLRGELARAHTEMGQASAIRGEIEIMHLELQRGRAAVEYEKKAHADNMEQSEAMEKNMNAMAFEFENLRTELANAEKRARASAAAAAAANPGPGYADAAAVAANLGPGYAGNYGNPEVAYGVQGSTDGSSQYGSGALSYGSYDMQQYHIQR